MIGFVSRLTLGGLTSGVLLGSLLIALVAPVANGAAPTPHVVTFIDGKHGLQLSLQIDPSATDPGAFAFMVDERKVIYRGVAGASMRVIGDTDDPNRMVVRYSGPATIGPSSDLLDQDATPAAATPTNVTLIANIHPDRHTATAFLLEGISDPDAENPDRDDNRDDDNPPPLHYHLVARGSTEPIGPTLRTFEQAVTTADWTTVYGLMNQDVHDSFNAASFAASAASQSGANGAITALSRVKVYAPQTDDNGITSQAVAYDATLSGGKKQRYVAVFVNEKNAWKVWFTDTPPA